MWHSLSHKPRTYLHADLIEHQAGCVVEETVSFPTKLYGVLLHLMQHWDKDGHKEQKEIKRRRVGFKPESLHLWQIRVSVCRLVCTFNPIEGLGYESLDGFETLHHKAQSGKLTAAVGDQLIRQRLWKYLLQAEGLESSKGCTWWKGQRMGFSFCQIHLHSRQHDGRTTLKRVPAPDYFSACMRISMYYAVQFQSVAVPIRRSSSWRTSTASLTLESGSVRLSHALRIELGVISENLARKTCKLDFT